MLWTTLVLLVVVITANARSIYDDWFGGGLATETSLHTDSLGCDEWEPLWLQAQAIPTASLVPVCTPAGRLDGRQCGGQRRSIRDHSQLRPCRRRPG